MEKKLNFTLIVLALIMLVSCTKNKKEEVQITQKGHTEQIEKKVAPKDCKDVHWSHQKGADGPENWKDLCDGFSDCGKRAQSPINIVTKDVAKGAGLIAPRFHYGKSTVDIINNSHTVQFNISGENKVILSGKEYKLLQFHYHALSEHTINGKHYPIEVHFVHQYSDTDFAVLGVMFEEGKENKLFKKYLDKFPTKKGEFKSKDMLDLLSLFPDNKSYYNYKGSLTTPPCSEVVNWYVLETPITASKEQIAKLSKILHNNYRPIQHLNDREVKVYSE